MNKDISKDQEIIELKQDCENFTINMKAATTRKDLLKLGAEISSINYKMLEILEKHKELFCNGK